MNKLTKKITICILSILFVFSSVICLTLFTSNKASAEPTVEFTGFGLNNEDEATLKTVDLVFSGSFDYARLSNDLNYADKIYYTPVGGIATHFRYIYTNPDNATGTDDDCVLRLMAASGTTIENGAILTIVEGTEISGQTLQGLTFTMVEGQWQLDSTVEPTVTFVGINEAQNNVAWEAEGGSSFTALYLVFEGDEFAQNNNQNVAGITYTLAGGTATVFPFAWSQPTGTYTNSNLNTLILLTQGVTFTEGSTVNITAGTQYGKEEGGYQVLPEVNLVLENGKWVDPNVTAEAIVEFTGFGLNNEDEATLKTVDLVFSGSFDYARLSNDLNYADKIYYTPVGGIATQFRYIYTNPDNATGTDDDCVLRLMAASGTTIENGAILTIVEGTEISGQTLQGLTFTMVEGQWQLDSTVESTVTFVGVDEEQNNAPWPSATSWTATYLVFEENVFTAQTATSESIYYTALNSDEKIYFKAVWVDASASNKIMLLDDEKVVPAGATLHVERCAPFQTQYLPEITLYMNYEGNWQTTVPTPPQIEPTVAFGSIDVTQNNTSWNNSNNGWMAVYMTFTGADFTGDNLGLSATLPEGVACTPVGATPTNYGIWRSGNQLQFLYYTDGTDTALSDGSTFTIQKGTNLYGQIFPEVNLIVQNGKWVDPNAVIEPTVTFVGIDEEQNNAPWPSATSWTATYLVFEENVFTAQTATSESIYYTTLNSDEKIYFKAVWVDASAPNKIMLLDDEKVVPAGATLHVERCASFQTQYLPEITFYMGLDGKWQNDIVEELPRANFMGIGGQVMDGSIFEANEGQKDGHSLIHIQFDRVLSEIKIDVTISNLGGAIKLNGQPFANDKVAYMVKGFNDGTSLELLLLFSAADDFSDGDVITIDEGTMVGGVTLSEVTLTFDASTETWQAPKKEPTMSFDGVSSSQNNASWESNGGWTATYLVFNGNAPFIASTSCDKTAVYYTTPFSDTHYSFEAVWVQQQGSANLFTIMLLSNNVNVPNNSTLHIESGTSFQGQYLPEVTLYLIDGKWQLEDTRDKTPPTFDVADGTIITTTAEKPFILNVKAFDASDNAECAVSYTLSSGALDANDKLVQGEYTCLVTAMDSCGNVATITLTVNVGKKDTVAPTITVPETITAFVGVDAEFVFDVTDNYDEVTCDVVWSDGAFDENGKLVKGTHQVTITSTDLTGNVASETVTVNVIETSIEDLIENPNKGDVSSGDGCNSSIGSESLVIFLIIAVCVGAVLIIKRKTNKNN